MKVITRPTRRQILRGGAATATVATLGLAAPALVRAQPTPVIRKPAHELSHGDPEVEALKTAINVLKNIPNHHPAHWSQMARYHAQLCGPSSGELDFRAEIHFTWWFLPWHRAYLGVVEHILQIAAQDATLGLPYWDWVRHPEVPDIFTGDPAENPLAHGARNIGVAGGSDDWLALTSADEAGIVGASDFNVFGGGPVIVDPATGQASLSQAGALDRGLHGLGHVFVGGDMGDFRTAGQDPLFYCHHANVDRMWEVWRNAAAPTLPRNDPADDIWRDRRFAFQEVNGGALVAQSGDMVDTTEIRYERFSVAGDQELLHRYQYEKVTLDNDEIVVAGGPLPETGGIFETRVVDGELAISERPVTVAVSSALPEAPGFSPDSGFRFVALLEGVSVPRGSAQILVNVTADDKSTLAERISLLPFLSEEDTTATRINFEVDITSAMREVGGTLSTINVELRLAGAASGQVLAVDTVSLTRRR
ncbi:MAG: tyrosinase family protein [Pseudomonadota bacterium]